MRGDAGEASRWLEQAQHDLQDAQFCADGGRFNLACFLAQQAAEKALKAFIYAQGVDMVWGHSVADLCRDAAGFDPSFEDLIRSAAPLDQYYIPTRYPNGLPGGIPSQAFDQESADLALRRGRETLDFVRARIGSDE